MMIKHRRTPRGSGPLGRERRFPSVRLAWSDDETGELFWMDVQTNAEGFLTELRDEGFPVVPLPGQSDEHVPGPRNGRSPEPRRGAD
jgi:hypothetical protein